MTTKTLTRKQRRNRARADARRAAQKANGGTPPPKLTGQPAPTVEPRPPRPKRWRTGLWQGGEEGERYIKQFVAERFGGLWSAGFPNSSRAVAYVRMNEDEGALDILGALVVNWRYGYFDAELAIFIEPEAGVGLRPSFFREGFKWLFTPRDEGLGLSRVTCEIAADNERAQSFVERLGFIREGYLKRRFDGHRDAIVYGLTAEAVNRWLR